MLKTKKKEHLNIYAMGLSSASIAYLENNEFLETLCDECPAVEVTPDSWTSPGDTDCPAHFEYTSPNCIKRALVEDIIGFLMEVDGLWIR